MKISGRKGLTFRIRIGMAYRGNVMGPDVIPAQKVISHLPTFR